MSSNCQPALRAEVDAIADFLDHKGQRVMAERIRRGEHHRPHAVAATAPPRARGMEETRGWDQEDGA